MRIRRNNKNHSLRVAVFAIWGLGLILFIGLGVGVWAQYKTNAALSQKFATPSLTRTSTAPTSTSTTPTPGNTYAPTATFPSSTPSPSATPEPSATLTPTATPEIQATVIGYSAGWLPLEIYAFGDGPHERMIVAGIHGGYEWNTVVLADELIAYIHQHPEIIPADKRLYILRILNPDGEARSRGAEGRANNNGVDINRNFPANWQADWPRTGCWDHGEITAGPRAASEPETNAIMTFILTHRIEALISYHSAALGIFAGGQPASLASLSLAGTLAEVSDYPYPNVNTGCVATGQLIDWASNAGIAAVDIELTNHRDIDFEQNLRILETFLAWDR